MADHRPRIPAPTPVVTPSPTPLSDAEKSPLEFVKVLERPLEECMRALKRANFAIIMGLVIGLIAVCAAWPHAAGLATDIIKSARGEPVPSSTPAWNGCRVEPDDTLRCTKREESP